MAGRKKMYKKKRGRKTQTRGIIYNPRSGFGPLGRSFMATFNYSETVVIDPVTSESGDHVFSASGIAKPDYSNAANVHQPYGTDQITPFFDHYTVVGSKCTVKAVSGQIGLPCCLGLALKDAATAINTSAKALRERGGTQLRLLAPVGSGNNKMIISKTYSAKKFHGKAAIVGDANLRGNTSAISDYANNPAEQAFYHVVVAPQHQGDNVGAQIVQVDIQYTVVFTEPKVLASS